MQSREGRLDLSVTLS
nr:unnamed protein product [Callosobruchus chinensis]